MYNTIIMQVYLGVVGAKGYNFHHSHPQQLTFPTYNNNNFVWMPFGCWCLTCLEQILTYNIIIIDKYMYFA